MGVPYVEDSDAPPLPIEYGRMISEKVQGHNLKMIFEPGRMIAGNAGVLLAKVEYVKTGGARNFLIIDAAMNDLIRPALYSAHHDIQPVSQRNSDGITSPYDVVGPVCETGDTFTEQRELPDMQAGDHLVIHSAGAYGAVQASQYNTRPLIPEVLVSGDKFKVVRERPKVEDILKTESIPDWV